MKQTITITLKGISVGAGDIGSDLEGFIRLILEPHRGNSLEDYDIKVHDPIWFEGDPND